MKFDIIGARNEGYTDAEIADFVGKDMNFDVKGAREEGYSDQEILGYFSGQPDVDFSAKDPTLWEKTKATFSPSAGTTAPAPPAPVQKPQPKPQPLSPAWQKVAQQPSAPVLPPKASPVAPTVAPATTKGIPSPSPWATSPVSYTPPSTVLPRRIVSEYDVNREGIQGAQVLSEAPRIPQPLKGYEQQDLVSAFQAADRTSSTKKQRLNASQEVTDMVDTALGLPQQTRPTVAPRKAPSLKNAGMSLYGQEEGALNIATRLTTGAIGDSAAGFAGLGHLLIGGNASQAAETVEAVSKILRPFTVYEPKTEMGQTIAKGLDATMALVFREGGRRIVPGYVGLGTLATTGDVGKASGEIKRSLDNPSPLNEVAEFMWTAGPIVVPALRYAKGQVKEAVYKNYAETIAKKAEAAGYDPDTARKFANQMVSQQIRTKGGWDKATILDAIRSNRFVKNQKKDLAPAWDVDATPDRPLLTGRDVDGQMREAVNTEPPSPSKPVYQDVTEMPDTRPVDTTVVQGPTVEEQMKSTLNQGGTRNAEETESPAEGQAVSTEGQAVTERFWDADDAQGGRDAHGQRNADDGLQEGRDGQEGLLGPEGEATPPPRDVKSEVINWLLGRSGRPAPPSTLYRGVSKYGQAPETPPEYTHVTPWRDVAERGGKIGYTRGAYDVEEAPISDPANHKYYRGGSLAGDPLESTRFNSLRGYTWEEGLNRLTALYDRDLKNKTKELEKNREFLGENFYRQASELLPSQVASEVFTEFRSGMFEADRDNKPGIWTTRARTPRELLRRQPGLRTNEEVESFDYGTVDSKNGQEGPKFDQQRPISPEADQVYQLAGAMGLPRRLVLQGFQRGEKMLEDNFRTRTNTEALINFPDFENFAFKVAPRGGLAGIKASREYAEDRDYRAKVDRFEQFLNETGSAAYRQTKMFKDALRVMELKQGDLALRAWHGSPHDFENFNSSAIGTGEGAQAYGHGLYFAGGKEVADWYRQKLSRNKLKDFRIENSALGEGLVNERPDLFLKIVEAYGLSPRQATLEPNKVRNLYGDVGSILRGLIEEGMYDHRIPSDTIEALRPFLDRQRSKGHLYEVDLTPAEEDYLLWDKPLSEQSEKVQAVLGNTEAYRSLQRKDLAWQPPTFGESTPLESKGRDLYDMLARRRGQEMYDRSQGAIRNEPDYKWASQYLHSLGIRGIKYLDGSSRKAGEGDYNYVIFSDKDVQIKSKALTKPPEDDVTRLITKPERDFYKKLRESISEGVRGLLEKVDGYDGWQYDVGDRFKSPKTGRVYEVTHRTWNLKLDVPMYGYKSVGEKDVESGTMFANEWEGKFTGKNPGVHGYMIRLGGPSKTKALTRPQEEEAWRRYFGGQHVDAVIEQANNPMSRSTIVMMSPDDFLALARQGSDSHKAATVRGIIEKGEKWSDLPSLMFKHDGKGTATVTGHEGRHRARYLKEQGITEMPVEFVSVSSGEGNAIRWGAAIQQPGSVFYKVEHWPETLVAEDGRNTRPFPESATFPRTGGAKGLSSPTDTDVTSKFSVDLAEIWNTAANQTYDGARLGNVAVREVLQNSLDAVIIGMERGEIKKGKIDLKVDMNKGLEIEDNGIGMSAEDIANRFLTLGDKTKNAQGEGRFGGFGLAKAVILGFTPKNTWSLTTRGFYTDSTITNAEGKIQRIGTPRQGTKLVSESPEARGAFDNKAPLYIYFTEAPKGVTFTYNGEVVKTPSLGKALGRQTFYPNDETTITVTVYKEQKDPKPRKSELEVDPRTGREVFGSEKKSDPFYRTQLNGMAILRLSDPKTGAKLVQGVTWDGLPGVAIVDIDTSLTPSDYNYPLSTSRNRLAYNVAAREVTAYLDEFKKKEATNASDTTETTEKPAPQHGKWKTVMAKKEKDTDLVAILDEANTYFSGLTEWDGSQMSPVRVDPSKWVIRQEKGSKLPVATASMVRVAALYEAAFRMAATNLGLPFSHLVILDYGPENQVLANYNEDTGVTGFNARSFDYTLVKSPVQLARYIAHLADHELTHHWEGGHDSRFVGKLADLTGKTMTDDSWTSLIKMAEILTGKTVAEEVARMNEPMTVQVEMATAEPWLFKEFIGEEKQYELFVAEQNQQLFWPFGETDTAFLGPEQWGLWDHPRGAGFYNDPEYQAPRPPNGNPARDAHKPSPAAGAESQRAGEPDDLASDAGSLRSGERDVESHSSGPVETNVSGEGYGEDVREPFSDLPQEDGQDPLDQERTLKIMRLPQVIQLARAIMNGKNPKVVKQIQNTPTVRGRFWKKDGGQIVVRADLIKEPGQMEKTISHEIGHFADKDSGGNILGHIASLKEYMFSLLEEYPGSPNGILTEKDRARLRKEARRQMRAEDQRGSRTIVEEVTREVPIFEEVGLTPEMVLAIWNDVTARDTYPDLYKFVAGLSASQKKAIMVQALKGIVSPELKGVGGSKQVGTKTVTEKRTVVFPEKVATEAEIRERYRQLLKEEIEKRGLYEKEVILDELKKLSYAWRPLPKHPSTRYMRYRNDNKELYADAVSALLNSPGFLQRMAPTFTKAFFSYFERKPELKAAYDGIQQILNQSFQDIAQGYVDGLYEMEDKVAEEKNRLAKIPEPQTSIVDSALTALSDEHWAAQKIISLMQKQGGVVGERARKAEKLLGDLPYIASETKGILNDLLNIIIRPMEREGVTVRDLGVYMFPDMILGEEGKKIAARGHTYETAQTILAKLLDNWGAHKFTAAEKAREQFWRKWRGGILEMEGANELLTPQRLAMMKENTWYATAEVFEHLADDFGNRGVIGGFQIFEKIGSFDDIENPFIATVMKYLSLAKAISVNNTARALWQVLEDAGRLTPAKMQPSYNSRGFSRMVPSPPPDESMDIFSAVFAGKRKYAYVDRGVAKIFKYEPVIHSTIARVAAWASALPRALFVSINPKFQLANPVRDFSQFMKNIPEVGFMDLPKVVKTYMGVWKEVRDYAMKGTASPLIQEMLKNKALRVNRAWGTWDVDAATELERIVRLFELNPDDNTIITMQGIRQRDGNLLYIYANMRKLMDYLERNGNTTELWSKVAGYKYLKENTSLPMWEIIHRTREFIGTPNTKRHGAWSILMNNLFIFSDVRLRSLEVMWKAFKMNPKRYIVKTLVFNTLWRILFKLGAAGYLGNMAFQKWFKKAAKKIPMSDVANNISVPLWIRPDGKVEYVRGPEDYAGQYIGQLTASVMDVAFGKGDITGAGALTDVALNLNPYNFTPAVSVPWMLGSYYAIGNIAYDQYHRRGHLTNDEAAAGGKFAAAALGKEAWNNLGLNLLYEFNRSGASRDKTWDENARRYLPFSAIPGTFLKSSDAGERDPYARAKGKAASEDARQRLVARELAEKIMNGETYTEKDIRGMGGKSDTVLSQMLHMELVKRGYYGLDAVTRARSKGEERAIMEAWPKNEE